ncbi:MAG TPA: sigma-70 family RNA polymerase sigma factor [Polyangiaceae bacterium]|nr:sigma-70 family RNA polymerase sigma factor [Polyangiaceae bacterium]
MTAAPLVPTRVEFDAFYRAHAAFVWRSLRRLCVPEAALDDALQEVFIVVHRRFHELRPGPTERAWLFVIAQRVASSHRRWLRRKGNLVPLDEQVVGTSPSPLEGAMRRQASALVQEFLEQLDEPRRAAFVLSELEQMTGAEAHVALGVNQNTLYYRLASARRAFVAFLERRGVVERPAKEEP